MLCCAVLQRVSDVLKQPSLLQSVDVAACLQQWHLTHTQEAAAAAAGSASRQHQHHPHQQQQQQQSAMLTRNGAAAGGGSSGDSSGSSAKGPAAAMSPQQLQQRLQADVVRCVYADRAYSPYCDMAKTLAGESAARQGGTLGRQQAVHLGSTAMSGEECMGMASYQLMQAGQQYSSRRRCRGVQRCVGVHASMFAAFFIPPRVTCICLWLMFLWFRDEASRSRK